MSSLRFGIMAPASGLNRFAQTCIDHLQRDGLAEPAVLIVDPTAPQTSSAREKLHKALRFNGNLWHLQNKLFPLREIPAYQVEPLEKACPGLPRIACQPVLRGKWSQYFTPEDLDRIRAFDLHFILKFAYGIIRGEVLQTARYGVWSFHHDDEEKYRGGPPGFWEIVKADPVNGALLQRLTDRLDGGVVLKKCFAPTDPLSYRRNLQRILEASTPMPRWVCLDILNQQASYLDAPPSQTKAPIYRAPNDVQMVTFWSRLLRNWIRYKLNNQRLEIWNVGFVPAPASRFLDPEFRPAVEWSAYQEQHQFIADPFLVPASAAGSASPWILAEELDYRSETGRIVELRRGEDGHLSRLRPVIDTGRHLSYPYVFEHAGHTYALPESVTTRQIRLYRWDSASNSWKPDAVLIDDIDAVDATVFPHEGSWWMLHSCATGSGQWSLYVWNAPDLLGPWTPHPGNPVKVDITSTRPAGNLFHHEGHWYRPAQDGSRSYGGALAINRIDALSMTSFRESVVRRIFPDPQGPYPDGLHTLSSCGDHSVIDAKRHAWSLPLITRRVWSKLTRQGKPAPAFRYSRMTVIDR